MNEKRFHWREAALPCFAILSVLALLFRLPNGLMDLLLSINLALSATIFLSVFFVRKPLEFSAFPTVLLATTLFRLVLNVSTTRLILTQGDAGRVIDAFSRFVAGDNIVVGAVIFLIFIVVQFVVITKGATRISEVSARFALDAMPGRQSAIDFDLNAGNITDEQARAAREELSEQADFFGAMDGASKFVRGDAIAGLVIVAVNLLGGFCIGVFQRHMSLGESVSLFSKLTIGDGLVSQVPAFLISLAAGLLAARSSRSQNVSEVALRQTFGKPLVLGFVGVFLVVMSFAGLPTVPLLALALGCFALAWALGRKGGDREKATSERSGTGETTGKKARDDEDDAERYMSVDPMELEIGVGLIPIANPETGPTLPDRTRAVRRTIASELGFVLPKVKIRDSSELDENRFRVKVNGDEVANGVAYPNMALAVSTPYSAGSLKGIQTTAPGSGAVAYWIDEALRDEADRRGFELWSPGDVLEKTTLEVARREAANLLTRDGTKRLVERLRETSPTLVDEALGESGSDSSARLARIQTVLKLMLSERVSIRRLDAILETLSDLETLEPSASAYRALESVRARSARQLSARYRNEDGELRVAMLEPEAEDELSTSLGASSSGAPTLTLAPGAIKALTSALRDSFRELEELGAPQVALVDASYRRALRDLTRDALPDATFVSFDEVDSATKIVQASVVRWKPAG